MTQPTTTPLAPLCKSNEFECNNGVECIKLWYKCDGNKDCSDNSDELNCDNTSSNNIAPLGVNDDLPVDEFTTMEPIDFATTENVNFFTIADPTGAGTDSFFTTGGEVDGFEEFTTAASVDFTDFDLIQTTNEPLPVVTTRKTTTTLKPTTTTVKLTTPKSTTTEKLTTTPKITTTPKTTKQSTTTTTTLKATEPSTTTPTPTTPTTTKPTTIKSTTTLKETTTTSSTQPAIVTKFSEVIIEPVITTTRNPKVTSPAMVTGEIETVDADGNPIGVSSKLKTPPLQCNLDIEFLNENGTD